MNPVRSEPTGPLTMWQRVVRVLFVAALALVAGACAWLVTLNDPSVYEQKVSLVVTPDRVKGPEGVDPEIVVTLAGAVESHRLLSQAGQAVSSEPLVGIYEVDASVRPGSHIIDVSLQGADRSTLRLLAGSLVRRAQTWVASRYAAFDLALLESTTTPGRVSPQPTRMFALGATLGLLIGLLALFAESKLRTGRRGLAGARDHGHSDPITASPAPLRDADAPEPLISSTAQGRGRWLQ